MSYKNICWFTIGNSPGTSGNFTVSTAVDGLHVTLGAADDGLSFDARIFESGVGSEVRTGCTYTHGTTTLSRGTLESSTSGSALNFTSAAQVQIIGETAIRAAGLEAVRLSGFSAYADGTSQQTLSTGSGTTLIHGGTGGALKTEEFDIEGWFTQSTGIFFPQEQGLWLMGASAVYGTFESGDYVAVYMSHSTDGSTWSDSTNKAGIAWRGYAAASSAKIGGSGSFIVEANGTTDRWALRLFHSGAGTPVVPAIASVRGWCRFWARRIGVKS